MIVGDKPEGTLILRYEESLGQIKFVLEVYKGPCRTINRKRYYLVRIYTVFFWPNGVESRMKYDHAWVEEKNLKNEEYLLDQPLKTIKHYWGIGWIMGIHKAMLRNEGIEIG